MHADMQVACSICCLASNKEQRELLISSEADL